MVQLLRPGDVDGDIHLLLEMPLPYTGCALSGVTCLFLARDDFERLLSAHPAIARRWLSSVASGWRQARPVSSSCSADR